MKAFVCGSEGSGKTYHIVVNVIIPEIKKGRKIVTNIPLNLELLSAVYGQIVYELISISEEDFSDIRVYLDNEGNVREGILYIIDEAQEHYAKELVEQSKVLQLFSRHRKYGLDFYIMTQDRSFIYRNITFETSLYFSKKRSVGGKGYVVKYYSGKSLRGTPINTTEHDYDARYFDFYNSYAHDGIVEKATVNAPWWGSIVVGIYHHRTKLIMAFVGVVAYQLAFAHSKPPEKPALPVPVAAVEAKHDEPIKPVVVADLPPVAKPKPVELSGFTLYMLSMKDDKAVSCWLRVPVVQSTDKDDSKPLIQAMPVGDKSDRQPAFTKKRCVDVGAVVISSNSVRLPSGEILSF